jgi:hypothetical protein
MTSCLQLNQDSRHFSNNCLHLLHGNVCLKSPGFPCFAAAHNVLFVRSIADDIQSLGVEKVTESLEGGFFFQFLPNVDFSAVWNSQFLFYGVVFSYA